jgi:hypothetical protein
VISTQKDILGAMTQQTSGPSPGALIASVALTTPAFGHLNSQNHEKDRGLVHQKPPTAKNDPFADISKNEDICKTI